MPSERQASSAIVNITGIKDRLVNLSLKGYIICTWRNKRSEFLGGVIDG